MPISFSPNSGQAGLGLTRVNSGQGYINQAANAVDQSPAIGTTILCGLAVVGALFAAGIIPGAIATIVLAVALCSAPVLNSYQKWHQRNQLEIENNSLKGNLEDQGTELADLNKRMKEANEKRGFFNFGGSRRQI